MKTALFVITLTRTQDATCRVSKRVRKGDMNRAVLLAAKWLTSTQRLYDYFGVTYNMYEIYKQDDNGDWINIETGDVRNAESRRSAAREEATEEKARSMAAKVRGNRKRSTLRETRDTTGSLFNTDNLPPKGGAQRGRAPKSLLRQRIEAEIKLARQRTQQKRESGES